ATSSLATGWHKNYGQWIIVALVTLHVGAIAFYGFRRRQNLVAPMWHGDKRLAADVPGAVDDGRSRTIALVVVLVCALGVAGLVRLGG
ncbi:MAG TPA: cytochrome B, partial [Caldimonas sp.]